MPLHASSDSGAGAPSMAKQAALGSTHAAASSSPPPASSLPPTTTAPRPLDASEPLPSAAPGGADVSPISHPHLLAPMPAPIGAGSSAAEGDLLHNGLPSPRAPAQLGASPRAPRSTASALPFSSATAAAIASSQQLPTRQLSSPTTTAQLPRAIGGSDAERLGMPTVAASAPAVSPWPRDMPGAAQLAGQRGPHISALPASNGRGAGDIEGGDGGWVGAGRARDMGRSPPALPLPSSAPEPPAAPGPREPAVPTAVADAAMPVGKTGE